jgi:hypothetical protein
MPVASPTARWPAHILPIYTTITDASRPFRHDFQPILEAMIRPRRRLEVAMHGIDARLVVKPKVGAQTQQSVNCH